MEKVFLALLGFLPNVESRLKKIIEKNTDMPIAWVNAKSADLTGVVINADFLGSANIQKYIQNTSANVVCCYHDDFGKTLSQRHQVEGISVEETADDILQNWLKCLLSSPSTLVDSAISSAHNPSTGAGKTNDYQQLVKKMKQEGNLLYAVCGEKETWVDTDKKEVYFNYSRQDIPGINQFFWETVDTLTYPVISRRVPLDLWLFEAVWMADFDNELSEITDDKLYKITRWPRPLSNKSQTEIVRLAAFTQKAPVSVKEVSVKTGYSEQSVKRFLYASLLIGQLKVTEAPKVLAETSPIEEEKDKKTLGLLGRLRKKLLLGS